MLVRGPLLCQKTAVRERGTECGGERCPKEFKESDGENPLVGSGSSACETGDEASLPHWTVWCKQFDECEKEASNHWRSNWVGGLLSFCAVHENAWRVLRDTKKKL